MKDRVFEELKEYVKREMGYGGAHGFDHVERVLTLAERIAREEGADLDVVRYAALLHDIDRAKEDRGEVECHARSSSEHARRLLGSYGFPNEFIERVCSCILAHRFKSGKAESLEERVLSDADKLDAMGAVGIARAYLFGGAYGECVWEDEPKKERFFPGKPAWQYSPRTEFELKLSKLKDRMLTQTGRRLAEERHRFMVEFFKELELEVKGEK